MKAAGGFKHGESVRLDGDVWVVAAVGATDPELGTYLHLKHPSKGAKTKAGFCPRQVAVWSAQDGVCHVAA